MTPFTVFARTFLTSCYALSLKKSVSYCDRTPHFSNLPTVQPHKYQMTLSFPLSASSLQEQPILFTLPCQKASERPLGEGTMEKRNIVVQGKLKSWHKVK